MITPSTWITPTIAEEEGRAEEVEDISGLEGEGRGETFWAAHHEVEEVAVPCTLLIDDLMSQKHPSAISFFWIHDITRYFAN